nr:unnamed protein product [Callosobruchus analis]
MMITLLQEGEKKAKEAIDMAEAEKTGTSSDDKKDGADDDEDDDDDEDADHEPQVVEVRFDKYNNIVID